MRLKWCLEADWTSPVTLQSLNVSHRYEIVDRPQLGAYFPVFRKTELSIQFVQEWLRLSEDPDTLLGVENALDASPAQVADETEARRLAPGFQKHQADQSIFSILFKQRGFRALSLEEGHKV